MCTCGAKGMHHSGHASHCGILSLDVVDILLPHHLGRQFLKVICIATSTDRSRISTTIDVRPEARYAGLGHSPLQQQQIINWRGREVSIRRKTRHQKILISASARSAATLLKLQLQRGSTTSLREVVDHAAACPSLDVVFFTADVKNPASGPSTLPDALNRKAPVRWSVLRY